MRFCLTNRQTPDYLMKCEEIKIPYKERGKILDYIEKYSDKLFILDMKGYNGIIDWDELKNYKIMTRNNFMIALNALTDVDQCKKYNISFYWNFPVTTFYDLKALKDIGAAYALIDSPLVHNIVEAAEIGIPLRVVPNVAYYAFIPREDGVCGSWIRPEDLDLYAPYVSAVEFEDCDTKKESALYRIYAEQKAWPGDLGMIITNLNYLGVNRMIPSILTEKRMNCNQRCMYGSNCKLCYRYLNLANPELLRPYAENKATPEQSEL